MSSAKWQVLWSPSRLDRFIAFGNEICLYKVVKSQDSPPNTSGARSQVMKLSDGSYASLVSVMNEIQFLKCVAWYPQPEPENLLAIGQANGRVLVTSIGSENCSSGLNRGKEFVPRHSRQCNSLAWNPVNCNLLAAGLDKVRNDVSLMVWDITVQLTVQDSWNLEKRHSVIGGKQSPILVPAAASDQSNLKPLAELSTSESTISVAWFTNEPNKLVAGQAQKYLRVFDIRDPNRPHSAVVTKAVNGVSADPFSEHRIASFSEGHSSFICIWDVRNFDKPIMSIPLTQKVTSVEWCPTRSGLLAALEYDSPVVRLYDIRHASVRAATYGSGFETDSSVLGRCVQPTRAPISSMSWHPTQENHMLTISPTGSIKDFTVFERISVTWSPSSHLMWGCGKHLLECSQQPSEICEEDISAKMNKRAIAGYGITVLQPEEISRLTQDQKLVKLWTWINRVKDLRSKEIGKSIKYWNGIKTIICGENSTTAVCTKSKVDSSGHESLLVAPVYQNDERKLALALCGWNFSDGTKSLNGFIKQLQSEGQFERAAAVALFNNKIRQAIDILSPNTKGSNSHKNIVHRDSTLNMVAMALSGYTEEKDTLWRKMCGTLCEQLDSPYLRSAFSFLTSEDNFDDILTETEIEIEDRIAFACKYLPDDKLAKYLELLSVRMKETGDLDGLVLTGITVHGIDLLEKYVNKTTDVQTAALVMLNTIPDLQPEVLKEKRAMSWIDNYRNLLDMWIMWHQRAQFDIHHNLRDSSRKPMQQVFVTCNFCGNSILTNVQSNASRPRRLAQYCNPSNRTKILACPGCRKPLPRCALCLVHMGSSTTGSTNSASTDTNTEKPSNVRALNPFSNWFTWCQTCRHGGHASHLTDWFKEHTDCPVTGCDCHCMTLDSVAMATPKDISHVS